MKPYMAYNRLNGPQDAAILVFAHTVKEAKPVAWCRLSGDFCEEYTDMAVTLMRDSDFMFEQADQKKLAVDEPHVIDSPVTCKACNLWGEELNKDGYCEACEEDLDS